MVKRFTAILSIFVACTVLLVHAVIPHHHHESEVCVVLDGNAHDTTHSEDGVNHPDNHRDYDACGLKQLLILPENNLNTRCIPKTSTEGHKHVLTMPWGDEPVEIALTCISSRFRFHTAFLFIQNVSHCFGLRAPPLFKF